MNFVAAAGTFISNTVSGGSGGPTAPIARDATYLANMSQPNVFPSAEAMIDCYLRGYCTDTLAALVCQANGVRYKVAQQLPNTYTLNAVAANVGEFLTLSWDRVAEASQMHLSPQDILVCLNRGLLDLGGAQAELEKNGMRNVPRQAKYLELRHEIPGPSDLIVFALKEAWDQPTVARFRYDEEFPAEFQYWMEKQGFGWDARTAAQMAANAMPVTWPQLYWRTHWQNISPTQSYEMYQRLREKRIHLYQETLPDVKPFTLTDLQTVLKINDYAPAFRDQLTAIAYNKPRLLDIARFYAADLISIDEVYELHLDYGYPPYLARLRTLFVFDTEAKKALKRKHVNPTKFVLKAYCMGVMNRLEAALRLFRFDQLQKGNWEQFGKLPQAAQEKAALGDASTAAQLEQADLECALARTEKSVKRCQKLFQRGQFDRDATSSCLRRLGMNAARADQLIHDWEDDLFAGKLMLSTSQIRKLVVEGLLPFGTAGQWLTNLGWKQPEVSYLLADIQRDVALQFARMQERQAKNLKAQQEAIAKQMKEAERLRKEAERKLLHTLTPTRAARYYVRGIFNESQLRQTLGLNGFMGAALEAAVKDAKVDRAEYLEKVTKKLQAMGAGNGKASAGAGNKA